MQEQKIIFVDIDGTLTNESGEIPKSAELALKEAKANGHLLFLATGRTAASISDEIWEIGFDGLVGAGGTYVLVFDELIHHAHLEPSEVAEVLAYFDQHGVSYFLEASHGMYEDGKYFDDVVFFENGAKPGDAAHASSLEKRKTFISMFQPLEALDITTDEVAKMCFLSKETPLAKIVEDLGDRFSVLAHSGIKGANGGELGVLGENKATAISKVLERLGLYIAQTIAFGDGANDFEMLAYVADGVAMGTASDALKAVAKHVTDAPAEDGIANGLQKLGIIA